MNLVYPMFALFALTLGVGARLGYLRFTYVSRGLADPEYYKAYQGKEPEPVRVAARHLTNLFETPVLFYAGCLLGLVTGQGGTLPAALAWAYVAARCVHTAIHLGPNVVLRRFQVFVVSLLILAALWVTLFVGYVAR